MSGWQNRKRASEEWCLPPRGRKGARQRQGEIQLLERGQRRPFVGKGRVDPGARIGADGEELWRTEAAREQS